jgi:hypothetical protein
LSHRKKAAPGGPYVQFLEASLAVDGEPSLVPLDPLEDRILAWLAVAIHSGRALSVRQVMSHHDFGAPATIHARLTALRRKGWVMLADTEDSRRKKVALTKAARLHFARLGRAMVKIVERDRAQP